MWKEVPRTRKKEVLSSHHVESSRPSLTTVSLELRLYVLLQMAHCSEPMATYNTEQPIRERVTNYSKSLFLVFHS